VDEQLGLINKALKIIKALIIIKDVDEQLGLINKALIIIKDEQWIRTSIKLL
jgi:hypothetical protein